MSKDHDSNAQKTKNKTPGEVKIIAGLEGFSGLVYLVNFLAFLSVESSFLLLLLCLLSFAIAYGLWRLWKWAWFSSLFLSLFGVISGTAILLITGISEYSILGGAPKIILDLLVIIMLLTKDVRGAFKIRQSHNIQKI